MQKGAIWELGDSFKACHSGNQVAEPELPKVAWSYYLFHMMRFCKVLLFLLMAFPVQGKLFPAPGRHLDLARTAFADRDYQKAIRFARKVPVGSRLRIEARLLLADMFHVLDSTEAEIRCLEEVAAAVDSLPLVFFRLAEAYYKTGAYDKGLEPLRRYLPLVPGGSLHDKASRLLNHLLFSSGAVNHPLPFSPVNLGRGVNSGYDEYWPSLTVDGKLLVFTRLWPGAASRMPMQEDFFLSVNDSAGWGQALPVNELNTPGNEGAQSVSADGLLLFYTLCNHPDGYGSCDIWYSRFTGNKWTKPRNAGPPVNTSGWEGQPSLSAFGTRLYFSSTRTGGNGKKDLWYADITGWSEGGFPLWGNPVNLGDSINTPGDEISPFIHTNDKDLHFCSDYWPGLGGFDIFRSRQSPASLWSKAENLGYPLNSRLNEQGLVIDHAGITGYFSSNREGHGDMDIFSFELDETIRPGIAGYIRGRVINNTTSLPVRASVQLRHSGNPLPEIVNTDDNGIFMMVLPVGDTLSFSVRKDGFLYYHEVFDFSVPATAQKPVERSIRLVPAVVGASLDLYNIYFETGSHLILPGSEPALQVLAGFLKQNPLLQVEIQGHTDNVGTADFNQLLSERRAGSVVQYLVDQGIAFQRLSWRGYGFHKPVAGNDTWEGRSLNRRTTLLVTGTGEEKK